MNRKVILTILDGRGLADAGQEHKSAIHLAKTPNFDKYRKQYPHSTLKTFWEYVGLPDGQMGNSEVGHMSIWSGRVIYQDLVKITKMMREWSFENIQVLQDIIKQAKETNEPVHIVGLLSDGWVHSHIWHILWLIDILDKNWIQSLVHAITDGRDVDPKSGIKYISELLEYIKGKNAKLVDVIGRYYAMDRDNRRERVKLATDLYTKGIWEEINDIISYISNQYENWVTDEFLKPIIIKSENTSDINIWSNSIAIMTNFRTDRGRELVDALTQYDHPENDIYKINGLTVVTMTNYDDKFVGTKVLLPRDNITETLGELISKANKQQIRIAETEKYPHVTFFFSGGQEAEFPGEKRILVNSPKVATYDMQPEMSAPEITAKILPELTANWPDFVALNFANTDMVGHTGDLSAAIHAAETVDTCLWQIVDTALAHDYDIIVIADHGNADTMFNDDKSPNTAHTVNLVPCIYLSKDLSTTPFGTLKDGKLADIAPTILHLMWIDKPESMDGISLL